MTRIFLLSAICVLSLAAQTTPPPKSPEFEVASIKPMKSIPQGVFFGIKPGGHFNANGVAVKFLIEDAYGVKDSQLSGLPPWAEKDRYDIDAKCDEATAAWFDKLKPDDRAAQLRVMLQNLLRDRFNLSLTRDTKDLPVYALVVAKNGPKLKTSTFTPPENSPDMPRAPGVGGGPQMGIRMNGRGQLTETYGDMNMLADVLSRFCGRPVINKTALTGRYDFDLKWTPDEEQGGPMSPGARPGGDDAPPPDSTGTSLFTAIQEQLGLKLEPQKAPMDVLVIQHIDHPTEN